MDQLFKVEYKKREIKKIELDAIKNWMKQGLNLINQ